MVLCDVCQKEIKKYVCPGCSMATCSLSCVKAHKQASSCDGKRKVTKFVKLGDFSDKNLVDDMNFLEGTARKIRCISEGSVPIARQSDVTSPPQSSALHCSKAVLAKLNKAAAMRNVTLRLSPFLTTRRKANSTYCNCRSVHQVNEKTKMFWHIRWVCDGHRFEQRSVEEDIVLKQALHRLSDSAQQELRSEAKVNDSENLCLFLSSLNSACEKREQDSLKIGMLAEHLKVERKVYLLDLSLSLRDNLRQKTVVEHPILYIIPESKLSDFTLT